MTELTYTQVGDYYLPNLTVGEQNTPPLGKYGRMRRTYLKEHSPVLLNRLVLNGTLFQHLTEIDRTAQKWLDQMIPQMMQQQGVTEDLKRRDQLAWGGNEQHPCSDRGDHLDGVGVRMSMNEYLWKSSDAAAEIRLLVEGAIALYEGDAMGLQSMAHKNQQPEAAAAFDTIGTALYGLREKARLLQTLQAEATEDRPEPEKSE